MLIEIVSKEVSLSISHPTRDELRSAISVLQAALDQMTPFEQSAEAAIKQAQEAHGVYLKLTSTRSMYEIAEIIAGLEPELAKAVLKKFVYAQ